MFVERLWRTVKYEEVYLHAYRDGHEARELTCYFDFYNRARLHQGLDYRTADEVYFSAGSLERAGGAGSIKPSEASDAFGVRRTSEEHKRKIEQTRAEAMAS